MMNVRVIPTYEYTYLSKTNRIVFLLGIPQKSPKDALNFDTEFTKEEPVLTPVPNDVIRCINQDEFSGFSFVNKNFGPERKIC